MGASGAKFRTVTASTEPNIEFLRQRWNPIDFQFPPFLILKHLPKVFHRLRVHIRSRRVTRSTSVKKWILILLV